MRLKICKHGDGCGYCLLHDEYCPDEPCPNEELIDYEPVKHARWIGVEYDGYADGKPAYDLWECSSCGEEVGGDDVPYMNPYCRKCGAKMDLEDDDV